MEHWIFNYGAPETDLFDNVSHFASKSFRRVFQVMYIANTLTSTYHPETNGHTERYNRTILAMMRCYIRDHEKD